MASSVVRLEPSAIGAQHRAVGRFEIDEVDDGLKVELRLQSPILMLFLSCALGHLHLVN